MGNLSLLLEYVKLVLEAESPPIREPFVIRGPIKPMKGAAGAYAIYREFPLVVPPEAMDAMRVTPDELTDGVLDGEHEIIVDVDVYYKKSKFKGSYFQPPDPDEWELEDWTVEGINGVALSPDDAKALKAYLGRYLTDDEIEKIQNAWMERYRDDDGDPSFYDDI